MEEFFKHLGLTDWPFAVVPRREHCTFIADRITFKEDIEDLVRSLSRRDTSSIHVLWSWFGAGKTHSLYYLANEANRTSEQPILPPFPLRPVYTEFPKGTRNFVDLYRVFMANLEVNAVVEAFLEVSTSPHGPALQRELLVRTPDLEATLRTLELGTPQQQAAAIRWLRGDVLPISEFRAIGISRKIDSTQQAVETLSIVLQLLREAAVLRHRGGERVIWMIDEYQRIEKAGRRALDEIGTGFHSLFNANPTGLSLVFSFSGHPDSRNLPDWFSPELRDRIGTTKVLVLPPMQPSDSLVFVKDVLTHFRTPNAKVSSPYYPFTKSACEVIFDHLEKKKVELRPRTIIHAFNAVLESADSKIEKGVIQEISPEFALETLAEYATMSDEWGNH